MTLLLIASALVSRAALEQTPDKADLLRHIVVAHEANRAAFSHGSFRFELTRGRASSDEDAHAGRLEKAATARGLYAFDAENARYDINYELSDMVRMRRMVGENQYVSMLESFRLVTDGNVALRDLLAPNLKGDKILHTAQIVPTSGVRRACAFPLGLGNPDHRLTNVSVDLQNVLDGKIGLQSIEMGAILDGHEVVRVNLGETGGWSYWIDLERGAIPLQYREDSPDGSLSVVQYLDDIRFEDEGGWLPRRMTLSVRGGDNSTRIVVTEVDVASPTRPTVFRLAFDEPIRLADRAKNLYYAVPRKEWSLAELPRSGSPGTRSVVQPRFCKFPARRRVNPAPSSGTCGSSPTPH